MKIRFENAADYKAIEAITYQAFENHPHHEPGAKPSEHLIVNGLRNSGALTLSLVAENETGIVGHIAFSPVKIAGEASPWFGLGPVSVKPEYQGKGVGSQLILKGLNELASQGAQGVVLLGEPEYYARFGFKADSELTLTGVPAQYFLVKALTSSPLPMGEVSYHQAFNV
jgi:putative acetyltransferase